MHACAPLSMPVFFTSVLCSVTVAQCSQCGAVQDLFEQYSDNLANGREGGELSRCRCQNILGCWTGGENDCTQLCDDPGTCNPTTGECTVGRGLDGKGTLPSH